jgi:hypothetical protein
MKNMSAPPVSGSGRETRLLLLVIVVAVAVLLVLARFRYPADERAAVVPVVGPIERLAARATFEELALIIADLSVRVQPSLLVLTFDPLPPPSDKRMAPTRVETAGPRRLPALRVDSDLAVALLPEGYTLAEAPGVSVAYEDRARGVVLVYVPPAEFAGVGPTAPGVGGPGYVAVFEGARGGPSARPLFVGRADSFEDSRWADPILSVGGAPQLDPGAFLFTLDGRAIGLAVPDGADVAIVRMASLLSAVEDLRFR